MSQTPMGRTVSARPKYFLVVAIVALAMSAFVLSQGSKPVGRFFSMPGWLLGAILLLGGLLIGITALRAMRRDSGG